MHELAAPTPNCRWATHAALQSINRYHLPLKELDFSPDLSDSIS